MEQKLFLNEKTKGEAIQMSAEAIRQKRQRFMML